MKIAVTDTTKGKFSGQLIDYWKSQGHEVWLDAYSKPKMTQWCDVYFFEWADNNTKEYCRVGNKAPLCIVRGLDIDLYAGHYRVLDYSMIDKFVTISHRTNEYVKDAVPEDKLELIPCGVNLEKLTLRKKKETNKVLYLGRLWIGKNPVGALNVYKELKKINPKFELHIRGALNTLNPQWYEHQFMDRMKSLDDVCIDEEFDDVNEYLEDFDLLIVPSMKEAFSYVTAEAMAKGIPVLINDFPGAKTIWPSDFIYQTDAEAANMYYDSLMRKDPEQIRHYVEENYNEQQMFTRFDQIIGAV